MRDWLYQYYCGAGASAQARYKDLSARWRKRVLKRPLLIKLILVLPVLVTISITRSPLVIMGVFFSMVVGAYMALIEGPPAYIENWRSGSEGERRTAHALAPLRRKGYALLHDLADSATADGRTPGNLDHVVVGPAGVFLIDTKLLGGETSVRGAVIHVRRRDDPDVQYHSQHVAPCVRGRAARLQKDIDSNMGIRFVRPVVVFWNTFDQGCVEEENVTFIHGEKLCDWLQSQTPSPGGYLSESRVALVSHCIRCARPPHSPGDWAARTRRKLQAGAARRRHTAFEPS